MKELSIEEKAKAYDEAIRKAKITLDCCNSASIITKHTIYDIFPELAESEDERIRKALLELVRQSSEVLDRQNQNNMIAWLKKQGEQKLANSAKTCKDEQKPAWSERDEYRYNACLQYFEEIKPDSVYYKDYLWLKSLKERINV